MGDIVWHGHHNNRCPLEELSGTIEERREEIRRTKRREEHELRLSLLQPASQEAQALWRSYIRANVASWEAYDAIVAPRLSVFEQSLSVVASFDDAFASEAYETARNQAVSELRVAQMAALAPVLALHATECPDCPWDGQMIPLERK